MPIPINLSFFGGGRGGGGFPNTHGGKPGEPYKGTRNPELDFKSKKGKSTIDDHQNRHGDMLNTTSPTDYLSAARSFLEKPPTPTTQTFVTKEGTYFRYDTATNEFGIINKYGGISTYFKPDTFFQYWIDQIERYGQ